LGTLYIKMSKLKNCFVALRKILFAGHKSRSQNLARAPRISLNLAILTEVSCIVLKSDVCYYKQSAP
jgi:hypothetical protein